MTNATRFLRSGLPLVLTKTSSKSNAKTINASAAAAFAASSVLLLVGGTTVGSDTGEHNETRNETAVKDAIANSPPSRASRSSNPPRPLQIPHHPATTAIIPLPRLLRAPICRCDERPPSPRVHVLRNNDNAAVQRRETIQRLARESTKSSFLSKYSIPPHSTPLGEGSYGHVMPAANVATGETVAVKKIPKTWTDEESFQREMRALLRVRGMGGHPHVCEMRENFVEEEDYYLVLDLVAGGELFDHLIRNGAYSEADTARLIRGVASALAFLHGIGVLHLDLKPENIMLSSSNASNAVVKLVDFGCAEVNEAIAEDAIDNVSNYDTNNPNKPPSIRYASEEELIGRTPAYCPPESFLTGQPARASMDMWAVGVILYIMLTGTHPYDLSGDSSNEEIEKRIKDVTTPPPIRGYPMTAHLSESAIDLIEQLMHRDPLKRMTADEMLNHPWVRGETATTAVMLGSDKKLNKFREFKTKLQAKFFTDVVNWSDNANETRRKTGLIEKSFQSIDDATHEGFENTHEAGSLSMSDYHDLLSLNMKHRYFPTGHTIYREGDIGDHMYFINSGTIQVTTNNGSNAMRTTGDFFGEGALLHPKRTRSATIRCNTPVHAMEISREYFEKYLASSESGLFLTLREKDKIRKRNRAKTILRLQKNLIQRQFKKGDYLYQYGQKGDSLFILEHGKAVVLVQGQHAFTATPGNICGEYSLMTGRPRNSSALCVTDECVAYEMTGRDFRQLLDASPNLKASLHELCLRRDFKKAVVNRLKKEFPYDNPQEAFDAADQDKRGVLNKETVGRLMRDMDPRYTDEEVQDIMEALDMTNNGTVSFDEFKKVFVADIRTSASM